MNLLHILYHVVRIWRLRYTYSHTKRRLHGIYRRRPLRVAFLVSEVAKWKGQSVYDAMEQSDRYMPVVVVYPMQVELLDHIDEQERAMAMKMAFFQQKKMTACNLWSIPQQRFRIEEMADFDLCFYQQPWDIPPAPAPHEVADRMLTFYFPYVFGSYIIGAETNKPLHHEIFRYILLDEQQVSDLRNGKWWRYAGRFVGWGHPTADNFRCRQRQTGDKGYVIYAPHFSFPIEGKKRIFAASTFLDNGMQILAFAQSHPEIHWVFKPHPRLHRELITTGTWSKQQVDDYFAAWEQIGETCYTSDYVDLFMASRAMLTDCGSFLAEYSLTGKPLIHLIPGRLPARPFTSVEPLFHCFYQAPDNDTLAGLLDSIVIKGEDPKKAERQACLKGLHLTDSDVAHNIIRHIDQLLS